jgi:hypothetical protein
MMYMHREVHRLSQTLLWRGGAITGLGLAGALKPEWFLGGAMLGVALIATSFGLYEITVAVSFRRRTAWWWLVLAHALASLAFGVLTIAAPGLTLSAGLIAFVAWLLLYAGVVWSAAVLLWPIGRFRWSLAAWGIADVALAAAALIFPVATSVGVLVLGALYAAAFGAWQFTVGTWLRRLLREPVADARRHAPPRLQIHSS